MKMLTGFDGNVVAGEMPSLRAVASTNGLNDDPGWRSPCTARLNWLWRKLSPPYIARISPVLGRTATRAAEGPFGSFSTLWIALRASFWRRRSIVVCTFRPPPKTRRVPYFSISCCLT